MKDMVLPVDLQRLISEKTRLEIELKDLGELIETREEELDLLRKQAQEAKRLKSALDNSIDEINLLSEMLQDSEHSSALNQMKNMEDEIQLLVQKNQQQDSLLQQKATIQADLNYTSRELDDALKFYKQNQELKQKITIVKSDLELAQLEIEDMKMHISALKGENQQLRKQIEDK